MNLFKTEIDKIKIATFDRQEKHREKLLENPDEMMKVELSCNVKQLKDLIDVCRIMNIEII